MTYVVAREAARIRADTDLAMPDALIAASAVLGEVDILVTNDSSWATQRKPVLPGVEVITLSALM